MDPKIIRFYKSFGDPLPTYQSFGDLDGKFYSDFMKFSSNKVPIFMVADVNTNKITVTIKTKIFSKQCNCLSPEQLSSEFLKLESKLMRAVFTEGINGALRAIQLDKLFK